MPASYAIGIDLGTTNSVLAAVALGEGKDDHAAPGAATVLPVPQIVAPGSVESRPALPSFLLLAEGLGEATGAYDLPWAADAGQDYAVGEGARRRAAEVPGRVVAAAKSWLAYPGVDRRQPILPWGVGGAENESSDAAATPKVSPVEASRRYLAHLAAAWDAAHPEAPLAAQRVVLTVPASFDAAARELTRGAALAAGLPEDFLFLEEPQAALYAWLADAGDSWRRQLREGDTLLVCDVGGGTTDLSLLTVRNEGGDLTLERLAVGNHLLVGGDNMDLALAHRAAEAFREQKGVEVDAWQSVALWHACRTAKETLLSGEKDAPRTFPVTIPGRGRRLIGGTLSVELPRAETANVLLDGFFPVCERTDRPARRRASGFRELGLPFEADAAVTRHLAAFLGQQGEGTPSPTHVLFNGGVLKADALRARVLETLARWFPDQPPRVLAGNADLDFAVARGAAHYGALQAGGRGVRIRGGAPRAYYLGVESAGLAIPGAPRPLRALCAVPFGMEEGTEVTVPGEPIGLVVGEPAHFRFFSSAVRKTDRPGDLLARWTPDELTETDPLETTLTSASAQAQAEDEDGLVPVRLNPRLTELGVLELWAVSVANPDERWKLEFSVREAEVDAG